MAAPPEIDLAGLPVWAGLAGAPLVGAQVVVAGIPYEGSAVYRPGAARAPERIRHLSAAMPPVTESGRSLAGLTVHDLGDLDPGPAIEAGWERVAGRLAELPVAALLTVLGGDHCSAIPVLAAQKRRHPDLCVLWFDAHPDLCDVSRGGRWTCGCALRRGLEAAGLGPESILMAGGRDFDPEEVQYIERHRLLMIPAAEVGRDPARAGDRLALAASGRPLHVSLDIDVLDPAFAPGTEIPSAAGISTREAVEVLKALAQGAHLVGLDLVEVAPPADVSDITSLAALKLIFEFWGAAWKPPM